MGDIYGWYKLGAGYPEDDPVVGAVFDILAPVQEQNKRRSPIFEWGHETTPTVDEVWGLSRKLATARDKKVIYEWLDKNKDRHIKTLSDMNGEFEKENERLKKEIEYLAEVMAKIHANNIKRAAMQDRLARCLRQTREYVGYDSLDDAPEFIERTKKLQEEIDEVLSRVPSQ